MSIPTMEMELSTKIAQLELVSEDLPAVIIIHNILTQTVEYMSPWGQRLLRTNLQELKDMGIAYFHRFFNPAEMDDYVPRIMQMIQGNKEREFVSFFHQVRPSANDEWQWYLGATRIFYRNADGLPTHCITFALPVEQAHYINAKVNRLLEENTFLRANKHIFGGLTHREKEVLTLMGLGRNTAEMATQLNISEKTVSTHRRNIKNKLHAQSSYDVTRFAQAFDLI
ncbi:response regulator transcription factor [Chitinophaga rhizosphaerae]|uniref:response regulator transcription factor n=1 Tax=Chitinophaga rhizosphaerae TaxID=1864947 RepID=UPI000F7FFEDF|nr:helix-turn-helix transcriptional regulator [Chitinophaga rhizosphaerae]